MGASPKFPKQANREVGTATAKDHENRDERGARETGKPTSMLDTSLVHQYSSQTKKGPISPADRR